MACPTCLMLRALLESLGVPVDDAARIGDAVGKPTEKAVKRKVKRKASAYSKRYGKAFKKVAKKYKTKAGKWKKDGFKKAQKAAHKLARRK